MGRIRNQVRILEPFIIGSLTICLSWINGHEEEYGFGFKALVCHDGVFDTTYNGFSTDELFFVSAPCPHCYRASLIPQLVQPRFWRATVEG